ncbi:hypothetical protein SGFS_002460 [Streptomyces graminofaciens]|uniref:NACHT domain-containing protein n=1 Tax=Streptomyces graminofaciens TaxID=68212 RepID=A0ABN5V8G8_9ACTN|nr:NACHT domain-containing protein [Streptomyces graminofaciens]BBC28955.1 hypothetical protein SGFS_002460 [Streptomyces graminofaciens]
MRQLSHGLIKQLFLIGVVAMVAVVIGGLLISSSDEDSSLKDTLGLVLPLCIAVLGALITPLLTKMLGAAPETVDSQLPCVERALAVSVGSRWRSGAQLWQLQDPTPMEVDWVRSAPWLADHRCNAPDEGALGSPEERGGLDELVEAFRAAPSRRVVVLGPAGSGKSILALRFTLALLEQHTTGTPLPVIFPLATWNPERESLAEWLAERLAADYEALGMTGPSGLMARELLARRLILPVLDGFDELPQAARPLAMRRINAELDENTPLLLTSRVDEYAATVRSTDVLTAASVLQLLPLGLAEACRYLAAASPPVMEHTDATGTLDTAWAPVILRLRDAPEGTPESALRTVLRYPLMVAMARAVCEGHRSDPARNPERLLDARLGTPERMEKHLLDAYLPAVYSRTSGSRWTPDQAQRWLRFLAWRAVDEGDGLIAWWRLERAIPRAVRVFAPGTLAVLLAWPVLYALYAGLDGNVYRSYWGSEPSSGFGGTNDPVNFLVARLPWIVSFSLGSLLLTLRRSLSSDAELQRFLRPRRAAILLAIIAADIATNQLIDRAPCTGSTHRDHLRDCWQYWGAQAGYSCVLGLLTAYVFGYLGIRRTPLPAVLFRREGWAMRRPGISRATLNGVLVGVPSGGVLVTLLVAVSNEVGHSTAVYADYCWKGMAVGGVLGGILVLIGSTFHTLGAVVDPDAVSTPHRSLGQDRSAALARAALLAVGSALLLLAPPWHIEFNLQIPCGLLWLTLGPAALALSAWGRWLTARLWCAATGQLPWRLMTFLDDAHSRGVLRQAGAVYQFRHLKLQERLVSCTAGGGAPATGAPLPQPRTAPVYRPDDEAQR